LVELREGGWRLERLSASASELHAGSAGLVAADEPVGRVLRVLEAVDPALVLGSSQAAADVDEAAARRTGVAVVRRRTAGGAVFVGPGQVVWVDLVIPAHDPLWHDDVGRAAWWVGDAWAHAIGSAAAGPAQVWRSGMRRSEWSSSVCFAGVGPGEVLLDGRKAVGVAQRRTRRAALFQTALLIRWDPADVLSLLSLASPDAARARRELDTAAVGLGAEAAASVLSALLGALMP
jgi:lipoate-protein ligase A